MSAVVGWLSTTEERFWRPRAEQVSLCGLPVVHVEVSCPAGLPRWREERRVRRGAAVLARAGVRRALAPPGFGGWPLLEAQGLQQVDTLPFCRSAAAELTLALLLRRGLAPQRAAVRLRAGRVDRDVFRCAQALCPRVRTLVVEAEQGGEELRAWLREEFGAAVPGRGAGAVTVAFRPGEGELCLFGQPDLAGLAPDVEGPGFPPGIDALPAAALLWEAGLLGAKQIKFA